ncbi:hypothetical protein F5Y15DRAFT_417528 [Xylariaceae sp. FL0016]|nr:hypothetical protein F5Y15DRAFT_417528 [Xylariaceae sp. FL0016]
MTTNSCGSALPAFDFPQPVAAMTRAARRRVPLSLKLVPLVAGAGLAYYVHRTTRQEQSSYLISTLLRQDMLDAQQAAARRRAIDDAYGARASLQDLEAATRAYGASSPSPASRASG